MERKTIQYSRKRKKHLDREQNMPSIDRLSGLPDAVLCHILSFLPTRLSVATNILARRWRFLWADVPNLYFDSEYDDREEEFPNIIDRVMLLHKVQRMNTFRLRALFEDDCNPYQLETWIATCIARHVQKFDLSIHGENMLPRCLFTCKTVVDLRLHACGNIFVHSDVICLPSLKKLQLSFVEYGDDRALPRLLSGCPVLEELIIGGIMDLDLVCCSISSPTLKRLMVNFQLECYDNYSKDYKLEINAPALRYLQVVDGLFEDFSAQMLSSLIEADICFNNYQDMDDNEYYTLRVLKFVDSLCNMKSLTLTSGKAFCDIAFAQQRIPILRFDNLTKLELAADWHFLLKFLESAENLEVLIIREVDNDLKRWMRPFKQVPEYILSHLRTFTIDEFGCTKHEFVLIRYVLWNAQVLERMEIYSKSHGIDLKKKFDALKIISLFERGSKACKLAFY